jgi:transcriptional regulator with XRE-family HTH domain
MEPDTQNPASMFGLRLLAQREKRGVSRAWVAGQVGVTEKTVLRWEQGKNDPQLDVATRVADLFGVSLDYLAGIEGAAA